MTRPGMHLVNASNTQPQQEQALTVYGSAFRDTTVSFAAEMNPSHHSLAYYGTVQEHSRRATLGSDMPEVLHFTSYQPHSLIAVSQPRK